MRPPSQPPSTRIGEADLPRLFAANDRLALSRQAESQRIVRTQLVVLLLATATAALAERYDSTAAAVCAAALYGATVALSVHLSRRRARVHWQAHRAAAEVLKSLAWQYMVHGGPFHSKVSNPDALFTARLEERLAELRKVGWDDTRAGPRTPAGNQITDSMRLIRGKSFEVRRDIYRRDRVLEQLTWYRNRGDRARRLAALWSSAGAALTLLALASAVLGAAGLTGGWDLTGLLSAAAAAGVAWQEMRRHRPLTFAHALVEQDLKTLHIAMGTSVREDGWAESVAEAERLVSPQHTDWLARFGA